MHGTTSPATGQDASADGHTRPAGTRPGHVPAGSRRRARPAEAAVRIPPFAAHQEDSPVDQWPLQSFLELGALPGAVPCARLHARHLLWEWGLAGLADSTELLVSEMITNAVQASREMARPPSGCGWSPTRPRS